MKRYAFVLPRYIEGHIGGAETLCAQLAERLALRGDHVEIFTTCAVDNRSWKNELPAGSSIEKGMRISRFEVDERNLDLWIPLVLRLQAGEKLTLEEQLAWMSESVNSSPLYQHIEQRSYEFDALFFAPYLFGTTFFGSLIDPARSVLVPCLHDESYAYQDVIASMFRQARGCLFNCPSEQRLAERICGPLRGGEVGMGFEPYTPLTGADANSYFRDTFPYLLYLGRKETGKSVDALVKLFMKAKDGGKLATLKLVIAGGGSFDDLHVPQAKAREDIIDLERVSEIDKQRLLQGAIALCQPSINESFCIVMMEGWLAGTPALVSAYCDVTKEHVDESGGGLYFGNLDDFVGCCEFFLSDKDSRATMVASGRRYVEQRYSWEEALKRFDRVLYDIFSARSPDAPLQSS